MSYYNSTGGFYLDPYGLWGPNNITNGPTIQLNPFLTQPGLYLTQPIQAQHNPTLSSMIEDGPFTLDFKDEFTHYEANFTRRSGRTTKLCELALESIQIGKTLILTHTNVEVQSIVRTIDNLVTPDPFPKDMDILVYSNPLVKGAEWKHIYFDNFSLMHYQDFLLFDIWRNHMISKYDTEFYMVG